jgi:hypothetical protein
MSLAPDIKAATNVFSRVLDPKVHPEGFRIRGQPIAMTFAHQDSFQPTYSPSQWSFTSDNGTELVYWDAKAYCQMWQPAGGSDLAPPSTTTTTGKRRREDDSEADVDAFFSTIEADLETEKPADNAEAVAAAAAPNSADIAGRARSTSEEKASPSQSSQFGVDES